MTLFHALALTLVAAPDDPLVPLPFAGGPDLGALAAHWEAQRDRFQVPGAAIAIVRGDDVFVHALGQRDVDPEAKVDGHTMFYIASITKTFTAMAACALVEDEKLYLDDPVREILPRFELPDEHREIQETATIRDLLSHRFGIQSGPIVLLDAYTGEITDDRYWHWLKRGTVAGRPQYTNVNLTLAGKVIESVTGGDWRDWLESRILAPAGMTRTTGYASRLYGDPNCAWPLEPTPDGFARVAQRKTDRTMHAAGGLGISAIDGARWILLNLDDGRIGETQVVDAELVREMKFRHADQAPQGPIHVMDGFCLGWQSGAIGDVPVLSHGGGYVGASAFVVLHPEEDAGFFVLVNGSDLARRWALAVAADCSRAVSDAELPWDPWERLAPREQGDRTVEGERRESRVDAEHLSRPVGLYAGAYRSEWLGTLHVEIDGDALRVRLGDSPRTIRPTDETDVLAIDSDGDTLRFVIGVGGEIDAVTMRSTDLGEVPFVR
ncbi:MAG: serine hydrolase [Planctomycetota bacterium]